MPWLLALSLASLAVALVLLRLRVGLRRVGRRTRTLAFLHPYCNDGGGGERVLWAAIRSLVSHPLFENRGWRIVVYTGDEASDAQIRHLAAARFGIEVPSCVHFVRLSLRAMTEAKYYPVATLVGQAVGSVLLAAEAVCRAPPDVLVDTTGLGGRLTPRQPHIHQMATDVSSCLLVPSFSHSFRLSLPLTPRLLFPAAAPGGCTPACGVRPLPHHLK